MASLSLLQLGACSNGNFDREPPNRMPYYAQRDGSIASGRDTDIRRGLSRGPLASIIASNTGCGAICIPLAVDNNMLKKCVANTNYLSEARV